MQSDLNSFNWAAEEINMGARIFFCRHIILFRLNDIWYLLLIYFMGGREIRGAITLKGIRLLWCLESTPISKHLITWRKRWRLVIATMLFIIIVVITASCPWEAEGWTLVCQHLPERSFQLFPAVYLHWNWPKVRSWARSFQRCHADFQKLLVLPSMFFSV